MAASLHIRPFENADLPRLHEIREAAFKPIFRSFRNIVGKEIAATALASAEAEQAKHLDELCRADSKVKILVAEVGPEIVGFVAISLDEVNQVGEIGLNAVHPSHAGEGVGTRLYEAAMDVMRESGMVVATVGTGGDPSHAPARRAYAKAGFNTELPSIWLYRRL